MLCRYEQRQIGSSEDIYNYLSGYITWKRTGDGIQADRMRTSPALAS